MYIISQLPGSPDVRDILQEVNIVLWEKMEKFEPGSNFGAWACTIAYYKILDHRKRMKREGFLMFDEELNRTLAEEFEQKFGVRPVEGYGTTELSPLVSVNVPANRAGSAGSVCWRSR